MAEALAAIGVVANIIALVDLGAKVIGRLDEFRDKTNDLPKAFKRIRNQLPVLVDALRKTKEAAENDALSDSARKALLPLVDECMEQIKTLDEIITKASPKDKDSGVVRGFKAVASFRYDGEVKEVEKAIRDYVATMTYHGVVSANTKDIITVKKPVSPSFVHTFRRDQDFVDRAVLDEVIARGAYPGSRTALVGLGGVGKSQIAIEYGYRARDASPQTWVFWVHAASVERFETDYREIAAAVRIPGHDEKNADILKMVHDWLCQETNGKWIMIVDNADDLDVFTAPPSRLAGSGASTDLTAPQVLDFLPQSPNGSILITSRNREVAFRLTGNYKHILSVEPMTEDEAICLLKSKLVGTHGDDDMKTLVQTLDYMPLAVSQAAAYISKTSPRVTIPLYLEKLKLERGNEEMASLLDENLTESHRDKERSNSIVATWQLSFQYVRNSAPSAARLLSLMCLFDRQRIPEALLAGQYEEEVIAPSRPPKPWWKLRRRFRRPKKQRPERTTVKCNFDEDWTILTDFSLIKTSADGQQFSMHALVQFTTKKWLFLHHELDAWSQKYIAILNTHFPDPGDHFLDPPDSRSKMCDALIMHANAAVPYRPLETYAYSLHMWACLITKVAKYFAQRGAFDTAEISYHVASVAFWKLSGSDAHETLQSLKQCGNMRIQLSRFSEAESIYRHVLKAQERTLGSEHLDTLGTMEVIADVLTKQHKYKEAECIRTRALETRLQVFGIVDRSTENAFWDLGNYYRNQGKYDEAYAVARQAYEARRNSGVKGHEYTWRQDLELLGLTLYKVGRFFEAEVRLQEALEEKRSALGDDDRETIMTIEHLARALSKQRKYAEAESLFRTVYTWNCKRYSDDSSNTIPAMASLVAVLARLDRLDEAERLSRSSYEAIRKKLGEESEETVVSAWTLATVLNLLKQYEEALLLHQFVYERATKMLGEEHVDTKMYLRSLTQLHETMTKIKKTNASEPASEVETTSDIDHSAKLVLDNFCSSVWDFGI